MNKYARRITPAQKKKIEDLFDKGYCAREIARRLKVNPNAVWNHVFDRTPPMLMSEAEKRRVNRLLSLTESQVKSLRKEACIKGVPSPDLARKYKISQTTALSCIKGRTYRWVPGPTIPHFKIRRPLNEQEVVWLEPEAPFVVLRRKGQKPGPKPGTVRMVRQGELERVAKKRGVAPCTISKWLHDGKIEAKNGKIDLRKVPRIPKGRRP